VSRDLQAKIGGIVVLLACAIATAIMYVPGPPRSPKYSSLEEFSSAWHACEPENRHAMLEWVLGGIPERNKTFAVAQTRFSGMTLTQIESVLGPRKGSAKDEAFYFIGSIESNAFAIVKKRDMLMFTFDSDGVLSKIQIVA
jgi:hypothetical protein